MLRSLTTTGGEHSRLPVAGWEPRYRRLVILSDVTVAVVVAVVLGGLLSVGGAALFKDLTLGFLTVTIEVCALAAGRAWHPVVLGQGAEEYVRLGRGLFAAAVTLALAGLATGVVSTRPWVFVVVPATALVALFARYLLRQVLHRARRIGQCLLPVMAAGHPDTVRDLIERTRDNSHIGWQVAAVCTADGTGDSIAGIAGVSVVGRLDELAEHVRRGGYRIVAITADPYWNPRRLQRLAWRLEDSGAEMVVAPTLMEVAGPRLHVSGVLGMPMLRVSAPVFTGMRRVVKGVMDRVGAVALLAMALPLMALIAVAIAIDSRGPVLYRQRRVGKAGHEFTILKFRTMVRDADRLKPALAGDNEGAGVLFKMRRDPRVTRVGAVLRRYSLDELPQLLNVLAGAMSLVGPRPPLPQECARYEPDMRRRLLVKPGLTGLWQVSGRSDLSWEEAVRLDLRYVEDWSLAMDVMILWKTFRAVLGGQGAY
ncbi:exopolysaccharide biosynthesis polyprenyl glycosylphosphotransferase [Actinophytocola xinjiangensis]|uniref:Exopolysaccharide biosynthesis polyprenyl glycosylphosphotransferase n=1 Tax=Actinophytocola xinjiangensis TaxID=485602 RepID=A0A7Z0WCT8_9PSEU|nr:sugar transferase [Actinophytocola xinjiangensis]OLF04458.1 exopolysaccharide biosynthesis polyprenyl glycosylphosphotransferase [Actinophytocola xinjiangensis]